MEILLSEISNENKHIFIMGDFNINLLNYNSKNETNEFLNSMNANFLLPYILQPTRVSFLISHDISATLIDNIYGNAFNYNCISGNIVANVTDHFPQFLILDKIKLDYKQVIHYSYNFSKINNNTIFDKFQDLDWSDLDNQYIDCNAKFDIFLEKTCFISCNVPCQKLTKKQLKFQNKPWITTKLLDYKKSKKN